jgi:hypothetical protein
MTETKPDPDELAKLAAQLFDICAPAAWPADGLDLWKRNVKGILAQVFRLGMMAGWDKHAAITEEMK